MSRLNGAAAAVACVFVVTGCGGEDGATTTAPAGSTQPPKFGDPLTFVRAGDKATVVGTVRFMEVAEIPADCVIDPGGAQTLGLRVEVDNPGDLLLSRPDVYDLQVIDAGGFTQKLQGATVRTRCTSDYPVLGPSQPGGKTTGWTFVTVRDANPQVLVYSPMVSEPDSTLSNLKLVTVSPATVKIVLPSPIPQRKTGSAVPSTDPAPSVVPPLIPARPAAGVACDPASDRWATDASGAQLRCAVAGGPTATWVGSLPFIGTATPGAPCELGVAVAESPQGVTMVCTGERGAARWEPGP